MKPTEIFESFRVFKNTIEGTDVPETVKVLVAQEFLNSLPPKSFSASCPATRAWLECAVQVVIDKLQAEANGTKESPDTQGTPKAETKRRKQG